MPLSDDYNKLMAQMIAQARPPMPTHTGGRGGYVGGGPIGGTQTNIGGRVDLGFGGVPGVMRALGWQPKSELQALGAAMHKEYNNMDPQVRDVQIQDPSAQKMLERIRGAGYPFITGEPGMLTFTPEAPDIRQARIYQQYGEPAIQAGLIGGKPGGAGAQEATQQYQRSRVAIRPPTEAESLQGAAPGTPLHEMTMQNIRTNAARQQELLGQAQFHKQHGDRMQAEADAIREGQKYGQKVDRVKLEALKTAQEGWKQSEKAILSQDLKVDPRQALRNLGSSALGSVSTIKDLGGGPADWMHIPVFYFDRTREDLWREPVKTGTYMGLRQGQISPEEDIHNRVLVDQHLQMLLQAGGALPPAVGATGLDNITKALEKVNPSQKSAEQLFNAMTYANERKLDPTNLQKILASSPIYKKYFDEINKRLQITAPGGVR